MKFPIYFAVIVFFSLVTACSPVGSPTEAPEVDQRFRTSAPSQLFFKNMRSVYYDVKEDEKTKTNHYVLRSTPDTATTPFLVPTIIQNWLHDQAYLRLTWRATQQPIEGPITFLRPSTDGTADTLVQWENQRWDNQYEVAMKLYDALLKGQEIAISTSDTTLVTIFSDEDAARAFRVTCQDFLKLTDN